MIEFLTQIPQVILVFLLVGIGFAAWILLKRAIQQATEASKSSKEESVQINKNLEEMKESIRLMDKSTTEVFHKFSITLNNMENSNSNLSKDVIQNRNMILRNETEIDKLNNCINNNVKPRLMLVEKECGIPIKIDGE